MKEKKFDCVAMKHRAAERIQKKLRNRSISEKLSFWNTRYRQMRQISGTVQKK